ncbi:ATP-binding protein [Streptomyces sp. 2A115]|uniref:ATP-binding protein n=1 Tax=Streptomyces sp. 2A115 TaxID=3457439 RepID=UPI003FD17C36
MNGIGRRGGKAEIFEWSRNANWRETEGPLTRDLLVGLNQYKVPIGFMVTGEPGRVEIHMGTWLPAGGSPDSVRENERLVELSLRALYSAVDVTPEAAVLGRHWERGGLAVGVPTFKPPDAFDGVLPLDRLIRSLAGSRWAVLVLAQPISESLVRNLRLQLINEQRSVQTAAKLEGIPSPLAETYVNLLDHQLAALTDGQATGAWRTAVYLLGDAGSYRPLASLWRGIFSGQHSLPEPVQVWDRDDVPALTSSWAMPDPVGDTLAPGRYRHPFQHQTLLTSSQLATYVHLPNAETAGFCITQVPEFDVVAQPADSGTLALGSVVERQRVTTTPYGVSRGKLTRHAFVTGVTGSGKTNTVFELLRQLTRADVPFLVVEPAKTEYRVLMHNDELAGKLQVFSLGREQVAPFRMNPFEVPEGTEVGVHLDLLRSVFHASFGMWTPLPQVLEVCLHDVYTDRGWDVTYGTNRRLDDASDRSTAFPTLTDLVHKIEEVVPQLGYEAEVTGNIRAALRTRVNSLRTGGKGRMLDIRRSLPIEHLLERPTVLELEGMGDDDDKAFMIGLLMIRLAEHRRAQGDIEGLLHLLVIEEAHRLLANTAGRRGQEGEADVRGKAVETFTNLLSEIRAYGQGVVVVDQIPTKIALDVLKNTNLKVAHRIVAGDDREVLGATMAMTPEQETALATLPVGRAAVFTDGEDAPLLLQVPPMKGGSGTWPTDTVVRDYMARHGPAPGGAPPTADCDRRCLTAPPACDAARALVQDPGVMRMFSRVVFSAAQTPGGLHRCWADLLAVTAPKLPAWLDDNAVVDCLIRHGARRLAETRGAREGWTYAQGDAVAAAIDTALSGHVNGRDTSDDVRSLRQLLVMLQGGSPGPFLCCSRIWRDSSGPCLCAGPVAELVEAGGFDKAWAKARDTDRADGSGGRPAVWEVCQDAAYQLTEFPSDDQDPSLTAQVRDIACRTALCFAQRMLAAEEWAHPATERSVMDRLFSVAGWNQQDQEQQ